jgi:Outer membrane protein beta-barrel domain
MIRHVRAVALAIAAMLVLPSLSSAQILHWGVKGGLGTTTVGGVPDYYDFVLCCHPLDPDARVGSTPKRGFTFGGFADFPIVDRFAVQADLLVTQRRHAVDLQPYTPIQIEFTRDSVEMAGLAKVEFPVGRLNSFYVAGGPVLGFLGSQSAFSGDPELRRGDADVNLYVVQALPYASPELLRKSQFSLAVQGGWVYRAVVFEVRFVQGLQSIFKSRDEILQAFVDLGGHEPTLTRIVPMFAPSLESAKNRDLTMLVGVRF